MKSISFIFMLLLSILTVGQDDVGQGYMGKSKLTVWVPQADFGYGMSGSIKSHGIPEAFQTRLAHRASIGLINVRYAYEPYIGFAINYTDRGTRQQVFPNNTFLVDQQSSYRNKYLGISGRFGGYLQQMGFMEFDLGVDYLMSSNQFDLDTKQFRDVPRISVVNQVAVGRNFNITGNLSLYFSLNVSHLIGRPWFWYSGVSIGLKRQSYPQICGIDHKEFKGNRFR